jgi:hypothetical protein
MSHKTKADPSIIKFPPPTVFRMASVFKKIIFLTTSEKDI